MADATRLIASALALVLSQRQGEFKGATMDLLTTLVSGLEKEIAAFPTRFYSSFEYTTTGQNFTHPFTIGLLAKLLWQLPGVTIVAIDLRLNEGTAKFQPDLVALESMRPFKPVVFVDYESPNSSDMRIPEKDVDAYTKWSAIYKAVVPYLIITTLPNRAVPDWELRYTNKGNINEAFSRRRQDITSNPFAFWYAEYRRVLNSKATTGIHFINIDGNRVSHVPL